MSVFLKNQVGHELLQNLRNVCSKRSSYKGFIQRYPGSINTKKLSENSVQQAPLHCHLLHGVLCAKFSQFAQTCKKCLMILSLHKCSFYKVAIVVFMIPAPWNGSVRARKSTWTFQLHIPLLTTISLLLCFAMGPEIFKASLLDLDG